jgi:predicted phosphodiesterase
MSIKEGFFERMSAILEEGAIATKQLPLTVDSKYAVISDLHLGNGSKADNFRQNKNALIAALTYYKLNGYSIILLGDIEEFHQFDLIEIMSAYNRPNEGKTLYGVFQEFTSNKMIRVFGNHDIDWALEDPLCRSAKNLAWEAIKLGEHIILTHGHQAEEVYEKDVHVVRFGTTFFRYIEIILGAENQSSITQIPGQKDAVYSEWALENKKILICGHTHNPIFASQSIFDWIDEKIARLDVEINKTAGGERERLKDKKIHLRQKKLWFLRKMEVLHIPTYKLSGSNYFNSGGCIYYDGLTNLEIEGPIIRMAYWDNESNMREQIWDDKNMNDILNQLNGTRRAKYIT